VVMDVLLPAHIKIVNQTMTQVTNSWKSELHSYANSSELPVGWYVSRSYTFLNFFCLQSHNIDNDKLTSTVRLSIILENSRPALKLEAVYKLHIQECIQVHG